MGEQADDLMDSAIDDEWSVLEAHRHHTCTRKFGFNTEALARREAHRLNRTNPASDRPVTVYECSYCGKWHVGHGDGGQQLSAMSAPTKLV